MSIFNYYKLPFNYFFRLNLHTAYKQQIEKIKNNYYESKS